MKKIAGVIGIFLTMPIWFYLLYKILVLVNASELMWFLFWIYVPATLAVYVIARIFDDSKG